MSINRRTAFAVRSIGVASVAGALALGLASNAFACKIGDFTNAAVCDHDSGKASITVTDKDSSSTKAVVSLYIKLDSPGQERLLATQTITNATAEGVTITFDEQWKPGTTYRVHVKAGPVDEDITPDLVTPAEACTPPDDNSTTGGDNSSSSGGNASTGGDESTTGGNATTGETTGTPTPSATASATAPAAVADTNAPKPATGTSNLAETGGGSNTGMIAGIAGALVVLGGGTVFMMRRRKPASHS